MEGGRKAGGEREGRKRGGGGGSDGESSGRQWGEKKARGKESLAGRDTAESDGKRSGQGGSVGEVWRGCRQMRSTREKMGFMV